MSLKHAILVLLENSPASGSDLVQRFNSGIGNFWNAKHQQVYQELKGLHADRLVEFEVHEQEARPEKKVYRITRAGHRELKRWLAEPAKPPRVRDALLVKVYGAHLHGTAGLLAELQRHRDLHARTLANYRALEHGYFAAPPAMRLQHRLPYLTLRRGIRYVSGTIEWIEETMRLLRDDALPERPVPGPGPAPAQADGTSRAATAAPKPVARARRQRS